MFSKTFALDNYFMHIPEHLLDQGRQLVEMNKVNLSPQDEKGYWIMKWQDDGSGETEVLVGRKNVKAYSCDCPVFQEKKMCQHVGAALLVIHNQVEKERLDKQRKIKSSQRKLPRIQLKNIVQRLSEKELKKFLLEQASQNPLLAGELKAQFVHKIEIPNSEDKYYQVIKNYTSALSQGKLNEPKFKKLANYLLNLIHHGEDLFTARNFREAGLILTGLMKFLSVYVTRYRTLSWDEISGAIHQYLSKLFSQELPPAFRGELVSRLRLIYLQEAYVILDAHNNLYRQLYQITLTDKKVIYEDLKAYVNNSPNDIIAALVYFTLATMENDEDELKRLIDLYCHRLSNLRQFVSIMQEEKSPLLREILIYVMQGEKGIKTKNWAFEKWLDEEHDLTIKSELLIDFIVKENREDLLTQLKDASGSNWPSNYEKVVGRLVKESRFDLLLSSFVFNKDDKRIIELLKNTDDRSLLLSSADYVYRIDPGFVNARLQEIIRRHLDAHVGHQSADLVLDIFTQLERLQLYRLVDHLFKMILKEYPERKHLIKYIRETAV